MQLGRSLAHASLAGIGSHRSLRPRLSHDRVTIEQAHRPGVSIPAPFPWQVVLTVPCTAAILTRTSATSAVVSGVRTGGGAPEGGLFHAEGQSDSGWWSFDVWES